MKTFVVVTNFRSAAPTVVIRAASNDGMSIVADGCVLSVNMVQQTITPSWGSYGQLTPEEAKRFGADFGIWFSS